MTLRHLRIFVSVFRCASITKAAAELHLAQPSVSLAIREMEDHYGQKLFDRIGRKIFPTARGKEFYRYALRIVSLYEDMEKSMMNLDETGTLRIGTSITIGTCILPSLITSFQKICPDLRIECRITKSSEVESGILSNEIDLGLIETSPQNRDINCRPFAHDTMTAIVSPHHELAEETSVSLRQLAAWPFLVREKGSAGREILDAGFSVMQMPMNILWESVSTEAIIQGVAKNIGVAVLPEALIREHAGRGIIRAVPLSPSFERTLYVIYHRSKNISENMRKFIRLCGE